VAGISAKDVKALRERTGAGMMDCKKALTDAQGDAEKAIELLRERGLSKAGKRAGRETGEGAVGVAIREGFGAIIELGCETDFVARNEKFQALVQEVADAVADAGGAENVEAALEIGHGDSSLGERIKQAVGVVGENMQLKRVGSIRVDGLVSGYVHGGGKLGVIVGLAASDRAGLTEVGHDVAMHVAAVDPSPLAVDRDGLDPTVVEKEGDILRKQALQSGKPEKIVENIVRGRLEKFFAENCLIEQAFVRDPDKKVREVLAEAGDARVTEFVRFKLGEAIER